MPDEILLALVAYCSLAYISDLRQATNKEYICSAIRDFWQADHTQSLWAWNYALTYVLTKRSIVKVRRKFYRYAALMDKGFLSRRFKN